MMPLGLLTVGERAEIVSSETDGNGRAEDMGIRIGKVIEMLTNEGKGPLLLKVDESRIALGRGLAMKIMVRRNR